MFVFILAIKRVRVNYDDKTYYDDNNNMKSDPINADCGWLYTSNIENKHISYLMLQIIFGSKKCFFKYFFWNYVSYRAQSQNQKELIQMVDHEMLWSLQSSS